MSTEPSSLATDHIPVFVSGPGQTDYFFVGVVIFMLIVVLLIGVLYFKLHALPEHFNEGTSVVQLQVIGILSLIALFTHNNYFWIAALLLSAVTIPDFLTPLRSMARSLKRISLTKDDSNA